MRYKSRKDFLSYLIFIGVSILLLFGLVYSLLFEGFSFAQFILFAIISLLLHTFYYTDYTINNGYLSCRSGFIKSKIEIKQIRRIEINKTLWAGLKLGLARKGFIVYYNKYDEIYISPEKPNEFVNELLKINKEIDQH